MTKQEAINKITEQGGKIQGGFIHFKGFRTKEVEEAIQTLRDAGYNTYNVEFDDHSLDALKYATQPLIGEKGKLLGKDYDPVNKPAHYTDGKIEVIDFIEDKNLNFKLGNAVKYISRAGKKDPLKYVEDLEKARWYLDREISMHKKEVPKPYTVTSKMCPDCVGEKPFTHDCKTCSGAGYIVYEEPK